MYNDAKTGYDITAIAAGMDDLERRLQKGRGDLDTEGFIPIYLGKGHIEARRYERWEEVKDDLDDISAEIEGCPDALRKHTLKALVGSFRAAMDIFQGVPLSFADKLERLVGVPAREADADVIQGLREEIDLALTRMKIPGKTLPERLSIWQNRRFLPLDSLEVVYNELQEEAVRRTAAKVFDVGDFRMKLVLRPGTYSAGRCSFATATMEINTDLGCTRAAMKHLVTHENFPGHATQLLYTLDAYTKGKATADVLLCTLNGVPGVIQEGIGDQATDIIDWVEDDDDIVQIALRRLRIATATSASYRLMQEGEEESKIVSYVKETGFALDPYVDGRIRQAKHVYRGPFNASYYFGNQAVREVRLRTPPEEYSDFIAFLYGNIHSLDSFMKYGRPNPC
jgi:hypothetical protein